MEIGDKFLMNIIFDELAVLCQFYETRKCKFRKCHKYFIAKKGKEKNYCCKDCADKEIKYQIQEGRRSKKETVGGYLPKTNGFSILPAGIEPTIHP